MIIGRAALAATLLLSTGESAQSNSPAYHVDKIIRIEIRPHDINVAGLHFAPAQSDLLFAELKRIRREGTHGTEPGRNATYDTLVEVVAYDGAPYPEIANVFSLTQKAGLKINMGAYNSERLRD